MFLLEQLHTVEDLNIIIVSATLVLINNNRAGKLTKFGLKNSSPELPEITEIVIYLKSALLPIPFHSIHPISFPSPILASTKQNWKPKKLKKMRREHTVFVPATIVPLGTLTSYFSPNPLHAPLVTPLEFNFVGALGAAPVYPLTVTWCLPPANESVVPIRRVAAPVCEEVAVNLIVRGELTDLKRAIGKVESEEVPTVYS